MPNTSIVVPVFNGSRYLPYFMETLRQALPDNSELIFVDDNSQEPVFELIPSEWPGHRVIKLKNNQNYGYSVAVNRGFKEATGNIIIQLNTDLLLEKEAIQRLISFLNKTPDAGIVGSKQIFPTTGLVRHAGMAFGKYSFKHFYGGLHRTHPLCCRSRSMQLVSGATSATTKQTLNTIGPLDERYFNTLENFDHCLKAIKHGYRNYTCADSVVHHWVGQSGPARYARVEEGEAIFWTDWGGFYEVDLHRFVNEALEHLLDNHPQFIDFDFAPLHFCRSSDESILLDCLYNFWPESRKQVLLTNVLNNDRSNIWLPMALPLRAMLNPQPYIYLVDRVKQLKNNRYWFQCRSNIVENELILDARATVMTTGEFLSLHGEGR